MGDQKYLVSVVTPFHNTDLKLFEKGFKSLKKQTLGFDKIEWVVVIHNSEKHYLDEVKEITKGCDNVKIFELNNEVRSPSSPRNYALDHCTGKYVAFMDSDDSFNTDAFEDITGALESTGAQIASFRAEEETEDDLVLAVMDVRAMFGQSRHIIELKKGDDELNKLIYAGGLSVWSKMILRDILEDNHIRFDETVSYGEDVMFSMTVLKYTDHVIILPQTIGYIYYMHHGSLAQNMDLSPDGVKTVSDNFAALFDVAIEGGYQIERLAWPVMGYLADMLLFNPTLPDDYRNNIRETMNKYLVNLKDLPVDPKFFTKDVADALMTKVRTVMQGGAAKAENTTSAMELLKRILKENSGCELGRDFKFDSIDSLEAFRKNVPVQDYAFFGPLVNLSTRIGETNLYISRKVVGYLGDFGSLQNPQKYPVSFHDYKRYISILNEQLQSTSESTLYLVSSLPMEREVHFKDDTYLDSMYGVVARSLKEADVFTSFRRQFKYGCITSPKELIFPSAAYDQRYARLLFALADPDVSQIIAPSSWVVLDHMQHLKEHWRDLVNDLKDGKISEAWGYDKEIRMALGARLKPCPERAEELEKIFGEGFDTPIIPRIWKNLSRIIANGAGDYSFYLDKLKKYSGDIVLDNGYYILPVAVVGRSVSPGSDDLVLLENNAFMELIPDSGKVGDAILPAQAHKGECYELVLTNCSGFYRFRTGMILMAGDTKDGVLNFTFISRKDEIIDTVNGPLDTKVIGRAILKYEAEKKTAIEDYSVAESAEGLTIYIEAADDAALKQLKAAGTVEIGDFLRNEIKELKGIDITIKPVQPGTQLLLRDRRMMDMVSSAEQMRPVRVLTNPKHKALFDAMSAD